MGRRPKGEERTEPKTIRLEPKTRERIEWKYTSVQAWVDEKIQQDFPKRGKMVEVVSRKSRAKKEIVTTDDF